MKLTTACSTVGDEVFLPVNAHSRGWLVPAFVQATIRGEVRLVTSTAVYLSVNGSTGPENVCDTVSLHAASGGVPRSPTSVHLESWDRVILSGFDVGDETTLTNGLLTVHGRSGLTVVGCLADTPVWTQKPRVGRLTGAGARSTRERLERTAGVTLRAARFGLGPRVPGLVEALVSAVSRPDARDGRSGCVAQAVASLVGFGPGLTPSGDDVLAGCLLGLSGWGGDPGTVGSLGRHVLRFLEGSNPTTFVAKQVLQLACSGFGNEAVDDVLVAGRGGDPTLTRDAVLRLLTVGATSGADSLLGLVAALEVIERVNLPGPLPAAANSAGGPGNVTQISAARGARHD